MLNYRGNQQKNSLGIKTLVNSSSKLSTLSVILQCAFQHIIWSQEEFYIPRNALNNCASLHIWYMHTCTWSNNMDTSDDDSENHEDEVYQIKKEVLFSWSMSLKSNIPQIFMLNDYLIFTIFDVLFLSCKNKFFGAIDSTNHSLI